MANESPFVAFLSLMVQTFEPGVASAILAVMRSPGRMVIPVIWMLGSGMTSHHAQYEAVPDLATSCSVPVWISVLSVTVQPASTHPPPTPIHDEEYSASFGRC